MDERHNPDSRVDTDAGDETDVATSADSGLPADREPGQSSGDVLTMSLFGVMVVIASVCFVIW